jgi:transcriptional regulator with XRE-family HTH domain
MNQLRSHRIALSITQRRLAELATVDRALIAHAERGAFVPGPAVLRRLAAALGLKVEHASKLLEEEVGTMGFVKAVEQLQGFNMRLEDALDRAIHSRDWQRRARADKRSVTRDVSRTKLKAKVAGAVRAGFGELDVTLRPTPAPLGVNFSSPFDDRRETVGGLVDHFVDRVLVAGRRPHGALTAEARRRAEEALLAEVPEIVDEILTALNIPRRPMPEVIDEIPTLEDGGGQ